MSFPKPQEEISPATRKEYGIQFRRLLARFRLRHPDMRGPQVSLGLAEFLIECKSDLSWSSFRKYRAALRMALTALIDRRADDSLMIDSIQAALCKLDRERSGGSVKKSKMTSAKKQKKISARDHALIISELGRSSGRSKFAEPTHSAAVILRLTGIRPSELAGLAISIVSHDAVNLDVVSAKTTQGRGLALVRRLYLKDLEPVEVAAITSWSECLRQYPDPEDIKWLIGRLATYYKDTAKRALGSRTNYPCLYTYRHQVSADLKAAGFSRAEVSAVMGHANDVTAGRHYARRQSGHGSVKVSPDPELVDKVRQTARSFDEFRIRKHRGTASS